MNVGNVVSSATAGDPASMLNAQLASALSTIGDAQYWEENISPNTIRSSLASSDPSNPNSTPALLKAMKWLLASISKGRDVSDFYPHVVKLVGAPSLEVRKIVYMFLVQYADHDDTTRELSLLSINSFQRGLADSEQLIRALALRVLTSIRIPDILQIQILGVQKCSKDSSPYVRKCAANALAKLSPRCNEDQHEMLLEIMKSLLDYDSSTMVLTSSLVAFAELCPERLELLHSSFRKVCHLLTDMDEWGQVVVIDTLARYCRKFFKEPRAWREGTAETIDRERRVRRTLSGIANETSISTSAVRDGLESLLNIQSSEKPELPPKRSNVPKKVKRRVVKKGFYSDEEDESTEEEVYEESPIGGSLSIAGVMRQRNIMGIPGSGSSVPAAAINLDADEDEELNEDHRLLLRSAMPLLKSRNAGVVLAVCSLQYYCGVSSVKTRSSIGKALVRIHRDRREIQYVVLSSIRTLVQECPSAFAPFLQDFFVMAMDPSFTRLIKLDILTALALEPASIEAVLNELRSYVRHGDKSFACASIRAVGTVVELARIVHDRHGAKIGDKAKERREANRIALNCLHGLAVLTKSSDNSAVVGECVVIIQRILLQLNSGDSTFKVEDPNHVQDMALRRVLILLVNALHLRSSQIQAEDENDIVGDECDADELNQPEHALKKIAGVNLPSDAVAAALWVVSLWAAPPQGSGLADSALKIQMVDASSFLRIRLQLCRLLAKSFVSLGAKEKEQAIHFATKIIISSQVLSGPNADEIALCESVLAMGRLEVNPDVRDRARYESNMLHVAVDLQYDKDALEPLPINLTQQPTVEHMKSIFLRPRPSASSLPLEDVHYNQRAAMGEKGGTFRFGTLSSLVGHRARNAYLPLPPWAPRDSPSSLRDPQSQAASSTAANGVNAATKVHGPGFYDNDETDDESSSSSESSSDNNDSSSDSESSSYDGDNGSTDTSDGGIPTPLLPTMPTEPFTSHVQELSQQNGGFLHPTPAKETLSTFSSEESSSSSSPDTDSDSSSSDEEGPTTGTDVGNLIPVDAPPAKPEDAAHAKTNGAPVSSAADDLKGLLLEPVVLGANETGEPNLENESSKWIQLVRPQSAGGLSVKARYIRGKSKTREVQVMGLVAETSSTVCLQVCFENARTDGGVLRRIRILQRSSSSSSSHIGPKRVVVPAEISGIRQGQISFVMVGIDFASISDRDDSLLARFDIKSSGGTVPVEIRPSLVQLLQPCARNACEYESGMAKLQGIHRAETTFEVKEWKLITTSWVLKNSSLTAVKGNESSRIENGLRFVGSLPASGNTVFVLLVCSEKADGNIIVCCEQALAVNGIANSLKKSLVEEYG